MALPANHPKWTRSSSCGGGNCVEVAEVSGRILIRDAKNPDAGMLSFTSAEWDAFTRAVKRDEFHFE
jgi:Domain of unknown function (DUF397)